MPEARPETGREGLIVVGALCALTDACSTAPWLSAGRCLALSRSRTPELPRILRGEVVPAARLRCFKCAPGRDRAVHARISPRADTALCVGREVCQDVWVPAPPSCAQCWRGATVVCNLSASNITIGKAAYRSQLVQSMAAKNYCCYAYCSAGQGESTNDVAWDGQSIIYECGDFLAQSPRFAEDATITYAGTSI